MGDVTQGYDPAKYGKSVGGDYDALYSGDGLDTEATVTMLAELARRHPRPSVIEFGIGTGRIALGLQAEGIRVAGLDGSESMVAQLREKPGGETVDVTIGDYRTTRTGERFAVVLLAFNGIFDPRGREAQRDIFGNAAAHLLEGGCFVVESFVLSDAERSGEWAVNPRFVGEEHVELQIMRYDIATNRIERTLVHLLPDGPSFVSVFDTYAAPGELDLIAESAGFRLRSRAADWSGASFTSSSKRHVSVYELTRERDSP
jgi:SAM-dependent methyltransferase